MSKQSPVESYVDLLNLTSGEKEQFVGKLPNLRGGLVFGGLTMGQALMAAHNTATDRICRALQCCFTRKADPAMPAHYDVTHLADSRTASQRLVIARQQDRPVLTLTAEFQTELDGPAHQADMPTAPDPATLKTRREMRLAELEPVCSKSADLFRTPQPVELWPVEPESFLAPKPSAAKSRVWMRAVSDPGDAPVRHQCLMLFGLDLSLIDAGIRPSGTSWTDKNMVIASLNHSMWFHRPARVDQWLLVSLDSPCAAGGRCLCTAHVFTQDGQLVATAIQEATIRQRSGAGAAAATADAD